MTLNTYLRMAQRPNNPSDYSVSYIAEAPNSDPILIHGNCPIGELKEMLEGADSDTTISAIFHRAAVWEHRRYEIATAAMQSLIASTQWDEDAIAKQAVNYADALIEELRKPRYESR